MRHERVKTLRPENRYDVARTLRTSGVQLRARLQGAFPRLPGIGRIQTLVPTVASVFVIEITATLMEQKKLVVISSPVKVV